MPVSDNELRKFSVEVVESLYAAVRSKLSAMLDVEYADAGGTNEFPKEELLAKADEEVRTQVVPVVVDHIMWLLKEEKRALGQLDCDMMMVAFAGQFVDTIVTNAVLKTQVDLSGKRSYTRTFVATSSGDGKSHSLTGSPSSPRSILRSSNAPPVSSRERVTDIWTRWSQVKVSSDEGEDENDNYNASNNSNNTVAARRSDTRQRRRNEERLESWHTANRVCHADGNDNSNNNSSSNEIAKIAGNSWDAIDTDPNVGGNAISVSQNTVLYLTAGLFHAAYLLSRDLLCYYGHNDCKNNNDLDNNDNACNYNNNNNNLVDIPNDHGTDATTGNCVNHDSGDGDLYNKGDDFISTVIKRDRVIRQKNSGDGENVVATGNSSQNQQSDSPSVVDDAVDEAVEQYLTMTLHGLRSALAAVSVQKLPRASFYIANDDNHFARLALNSATDWLNRYRTSVDSWRFQKREGRKSRQEQSVSSGHALLDGQPLDVECTSVVDRTARKLFQSAVDFAIDDIRHSPAHDPNDDSYCEEELSLMQKARRLWQQATQISELILMKAAIRANRHDSPTPVSLF